MDIHSTSKMLARMLGTKKPKNLIAENDQSDPIPELKRHPGMEPNAEMQNTLANMLGASSSKKYSPMD
ncbi:hypothetical protein EP47_01445 [Legionella norrlandica]|uniref:Uncharacterized protein n=1 Tax=Legionella norrlandica TaxID=1498499 RepID=A0A0A2SM65_9GAMM|nr:hypothetical protein [Legionella norrlandica]KGP62240.1 hypothetical protein EP47_01445 [Legionella norrlandica]